jgi:hypothetical protein
MDTISYQSELRLTLRSALERLEASLSQTYFDIIVTFSEVNYRHGTGALINRIFANTKEIITIRSFNYYDGEQDFCTFDYCISHQNLSRSEISKRIQNLLGRKRPRRILCIPYKKEDVLAALAIKDIFPDISICTYIMDDQNIHANNIPDDYLHELLQKSSILFGISQQLCQVYTQKYGIKFWWLPPVAPARLIQSQPYILDQENLNKRKGILIGNIWSQNWLERLRKLIPASQSTLDWYAKPQRDWLSFDEKNLLQDNIIFQGFLPEEVLVEPLRQATYTIIPTGNSDDPDERPEITLLSLPSRIVFIVAANTPIIILGRKDSAAAQFIEQMKIGLVCDYTLDEFSRAVDYVCTAEVQNQMRHNAAQLARTLSSEGIADWIWQSVAQGKPADLRFESFASKKLMDADVVIHHDEMTPKHGTGALVTRVFPDDSSILSIRSFNHYGGNQDHRFGHISLLLSHQALSRPEIFQNSHQALNKSTVKRIFCIPYSKNELLTSIAIKEMFNLPMATWIMDDQNIVVHKIPDDLMAEFLNKCSLRLATHPELRDAYEKKYGLKFWILPAVVPDFLVSPSLPLSIEVLCQSKRGAVIGNIWGEQWFKMLCQTFIDAGCKLDWFGNSTHYWWFNENHAKLKEQAIAKSGLANETDLAKKLQAYAYIVVPSGTLDERDDRHELSQLSLPGRILFTLATANTPIILLGSEKTSAANFINRFGIGVVCDYDATSFLQAVEYVTTPNVQKAMRQRAIDIAQQFSDRNIAQWIWNSLALGEPHDKKFEELFNRYYD